MPLKPAEHMKRYREKMKKDGEYAEVRKKDRLRRRMKRSKLPSSTRAAIRRRDLDRKKSKVDKASSQVLGSAFVSKQAFGKALKKVTNALPVQMEKTIEIVKSLAQKFGILPPPRHHRTTSQLVSYIDDV